MNFCVCKGRQETEPLSAPLFGGGDSFWQCFLTAFICFPRLITTCILDSCTHMEFVGFLLVLGYASPLITCQSYFRYSISMPVKHLAYQCCIYIVYFMTWFHRCRRCIQCTWTKLAQFHLAGEGFPRAKGADWMLAWRWYPDPRIDRIGSLKEAEVKLCFKKCNPKLRPHWLSNQMVQLFCVLVWGESYQLN